MFAVVIDPIVCHTWAGYFILDCWGIVPMVGASLLALLFAMGVRYRHVEASLPMICAWCPDFDPTDPRNAHASHGICQRCIDRTWAGFEVRPETSR